MECPQNTTAMSNNSMLLVLLNNYYKSVLESEQIYWDSVLNNRNSNGNVKDIDISNEDKSKISDDHHDEKSEETKKTNSTNETKESKNTDPNIQEQLVLQLQKQVHNLTRDINILQRDNDELLHANKSIRALSETKQREWKRKLRQLTQDNRALNTNKQKPVLKTEPDTETDLNNNHHERKIKRLESTPDVMTQAVFDTSSDSEDDSFVHSLRVTNSRAGTKQQQNRPQAKIKIAKRRIDKL